MRFTVANEHQAQDQALEDQSSMTQPSANLLVAANPRCIASPDSAHAVEATPVIAIARTGKPANRFKSKTSGRSTAKSKSAGRTASVMARRSYQTRQKAAEAVTLAAQDADPISPAQAQNRPSEAESAVVLRGPKEAESEASLMNSESLSLSDIDDLFDTPEKPNDGSIPNIPIATKALPPLRSFPAVVRYGSSASTDLEEIEDDDCDGNMSLKPGTSAPKTPIDNEKASRPPLAKAFKSQTDEDFWIELALGRRKLDASDPQLPGLSTEMQAYFRVLLARQSAASTSDIPQGGQLQVNEPGKSSSNEITADDEHLPEITAEIEQQPVPLLLPPSVARKVSRDLLPDALTLDSPASPSDSAADVSVPAIIPHSKCRGTRSTSSCSTLSISLSDSVDSIALGSPIQLHCELPAWTYPSASEADPTQERLPTIWEHAYDVDYHYESGTSVDSGISDRGHSGTSTRESSVDTPHFAVAREEKEDAHMHAETTLYAPTPKKPASFGMWHENIVTNSAEWTCLPCALCPFSACTDGSLQGKSTSVQLQRRMACRSRNLCLCHRRP